MINKISVKTKIGWISVFEENRKIIRVKFGKIKGNSKSPNLKKVKKNLLKFFKKKSEFVKANYTTRCNRTQIKVWSELKKIRKGHTKTYGEIAKKLGLSPRHVGKICGQNKLLLLIPCHRVIRSDGSLGGFSGAGGILLKKKLLSFESKWKH